MELTVAPSLPPWCNINKPLSFLDAGVGVPPLWPGQVSIAGSAIATLQKEFSSSFTTARKLIKPVKSPSPCGRAAGTRDAPVPVPPPFRGLTETYHFGTESQTGLERSGGLGGIYEDLGVQVGNPV